MVAMIILSSFINGAIYSSRAVTCTALKAMSTKSSASIPTLVSGTRAVELYKSSEIKLIDGSWHMGKARDPFAEFKAERIPSAQYFNIDDISDKSNDLPHMLPDEKIFADAVSSMGISNDNHVIVYVQPGCFSAPRVWYMFRAFGHDKVSVLDGGLNAWKAAGGEVLCGEPVVSPVRADFKAAFRSKASVNLGEVLNIVNYGSAQIFDARSKGRFEGTAPEPRAGLEGGHMPGALSLPFNLLLKDDDVTTFKTPSEIRDVFKESGIVFGSKVMLTCGSGVTAACLALGLNLLGYELEQSPIYDGSWSEWGARSDLPKMK
jgi:thiosulfate/3-mercaptopyruvate sulfurtransferase